MNSSYWCVTPCLVLISATCLMMLVKALRSHPWQRLYWYWFRATRAHNINNKANWVWNNINSSWKDDILPICSLNIYFWFWHQTCPHRPCAYFFFFSLFLFFNFLRRITYIIQVHQPNYKTTVIHWIQHILHIHHGPWVESVVYFQQFTDELSLKL